MKETLSIDGKASTFHHRKIMSGAQKHVQETIDRLVEPGTERGMQVAVYRGADLVVDAVSGIADPATERAVTSDTPFYNFSIVKGAAATVAHILAERGLFEYDTPVVKLWPEFGAHGKQSVTVRHVLTTRLECRRQFRVRRHRDRDRVCGNQEPAHRRFQRRNPAQPNREQGRPSRVVAR